MHKKICEPLRRNHQITPLAVYRHARGLTQAELADAVGLSRPGLSNLERGLYGPRLSTASSIAAALEVAVDAVFPEPGGADATTDGRGTDSLNKKSDAGV